MRHRKKIMRLLSGKSFYCIQYYEYDHCNLVLLTLDFTYLVVLVVAILKSNLERIPKIRMRFKEKSIPPCRAGPPAHVHMTVFHLT